ncbi:MAG TPA: hypothetical protein VMU97_02665 [Candidatus Dormibacteraeota bacterium]|nr:hypothetical protein [Candidatus Dormibacteraeota bacterium]
MAETTSFQDTALLTPLNVKAAINNQTAARALIQLGKVLLVQMSCTRPANAMIAPTIKIFVSAPPVIEMKIGDMSSHTPTNMVSTLANLD